MRIKHFPVTVVPSFSICYIFIITWPDSQKDPSDDIDIKTILCPKSLVKSSKFPLPNKDKVAFMDSGVMDCGKYNEPPAMTNQTSEHC